MFQKLDIIHENEIHKKTNPIVLFRVLLHFYLKSCAQGNCFWPWKPQLLPFVGRITVVGSIKMLQKLIRDMKMKSIKGPIPWCHSEFCFIFTWNRVQGNCFWPWKPQWLAWGSVVGFQIISPYFFFLSKSSLLGQGSHLSAYVCPFTSNSPCSPVSYNNFVLNAAQCQH